MKRILLICSLLSISSFTGSAQNYYEIYFDGNGINENDTRHNLFIDYASNANNVWQIGHPVKALFNNSTQSGRGIVTDTVNSYPINDTSSFIVKHVADLGFYMPYDVELRGSYYVDSDSLSDFGKIEFSPDNGLSWIDLINSPQFWHVGNPPPPVLTGNSGLWRKFYIPLNEYGTNINYSNVVAGDTVQWRFSFISDAIQTNRDGLMFDSLMIMDVPPISVEEFNGEKERISAFPNPTPGSLNFVSSKAELGGSSLQLVNNCGVVIQEIAITGSEQKISIDISSYSNGFYYYRITDTSGRVRSAGKIVKTN